MATGILINSPFNLKAYFPLDTRWEVPTLEALATISFPYEDLFIFNATAASPLTSGFYTLETAIASIPEVLRNSV